MRFTVACQTAVPYAYRTNHGDVPNVRAEGGIRPRNAFIEGIDVTDAEVLAQIEGVVRDQLDNDELTLTPETRASAIEGWDSLAHVRIMVAAEQEFGVTFDTNEITTLDDVQALIALIQSKL